MSRKIQYRQDGSGLPWLHEYEWYKSPLCRTCGYHVSGFRYELDEKGDVFRVCHRCGNDLEKVDERYVPDLLEDGIWKAKDGSV